MKTYKANKNGPMIYLMIGYLILLVIIFFLDKETFFEKTYLFIPIIFPFALGLWALFRTYYQIKDNKLIYRSGFIRGEIDINNIKEIVKGKTMWVGQKPALAMGGIIIKYNRFDDVYFAPKDNEELINPSTNKWKSIVFIFQDDYRQEPLKSNNILQEIPSLYVVGLSDSSLLLLTTFNKWGEEI